MEGLNTTLYCFFLLLYALTIILRYNCSENVIGTFLSSVPCTNIIFVSSWWMRSIVGYLNINEVLIWDFTHGNMRNIAPTGCTNAASGKVVNGESSINPVIIPEVSK